MLAGICILVTHFPFPGHSDQLLDLRKLAGGGVRGLVIWLLPLGLTTAGWVGGILGTRDRAFRDVWLPVTLMTAIGYGALLLTYPGTAIDVYIYAARSHLLTDYGLNPSTALPQTLWDIDPYVHYVSPEWAGRPSPYGPLWNLIAAPATAFDGGRIAVAVLIFKTIMAAGVAATATLIHSIARHVQPRYAVPAMLGWLWSPVVLWEGIANGHNDVLLALLLVAALWCWYRGYLGAILPLIGTAALLKVVAVIIMPAAIVAILRRTGWNRNLAAIALRAAVLSVAVLWIAFAPFYDIVGTIEAIRTQQAVMVTSPTLLTQLIADEQGWDIDVRRIFPIFSTAVILLLAIGGAIVAWLRPSRLPAIAYEQLFWFLLLATSNLRPWYTVWLVALAVVLPLGMPLTRAAAWSTGALAAYGYTLWIQHWYDGSAVTDVAIILGIMLLPGLLTTAWAAVRSLRRKTQCKCRDSHPSLGL